MTRSGAHGGCCPDTKGNLPAAGFFLQGCVPLKMTKAELIEALAGLPDDAEILTTQPSSR
jgi:hypothetical protein